MAAVRVTVWRRAQPRRGLALRDQAALWRAAARAACRNGDHEGERRARDTARLIERQPPLQPGAQCLT